MSTILGITDSTASYGDYTTSANPESETATAGSAPVAAYSAPASSATATGDTVSLSDEARALSEPAVPDTSAFTGTALTTRLGDGPEIKYTNGGSISWNGKTLNLKGLEGIDPTKDNLAFQASGSFINVYNTDKNIGYVLNSDGSQAKNEDGTLKTLTGTYAADQSVLILNNSSSGANGGTAGDVIINRAAGATLNTGGGNDKIFNFAASANITSGAGNVALYTVGLSGGTIDLSAADNAQVQITKTNMTGGDIKLSGGTNTVDASSISLNGGSISDKTDAMTTVTAKAMAGGKLDLKGTADITVKGHVSNNSSITTGSGDDTLNITGNITNSSVDLGAGKDAATVNGSVSSAEIDLGDGDNTLTVKKTAKGLTYKGGKDNDDVVIKGAVSNSTIDLGAGTNAFTAMNDKEVFQKLTNVSITAASDADGGNTIKAGAYKGGTNNVISLGDGTNKVTFEGATTNLAYTGGAGEDELLLGGAVKNATFDLKGGSNSFTANKYNKKSGSGKAQSMTNVSITATGQEGDSNAVFGGAYKAGTNKTIDLGDGYNLTMLNGAVSGLTYTGGDGTDFVEIMGAVKNSDFELKDGDNTLAARKFSLKKGYVGQKMTNVGFSATGTGSTFVFGGAYTVNQGGSTIKLGSGDNTLSLGAVKNKGGARLTLDLSASASNTVTLGGAIKRMDYLGAAGDDSIKITGAVSESTFSLGEGKNVFRATKENKKGFASKEWGGQNLTDVLITATGDSSTDVTAGAMKVTRDEYGIRLGAGKNDVHLYSLVGTTGATAVIENGTGKGASQDVTILKQMMNANVTTGDGSGTLLAGWAYNTKISMGIGGDKAQSAVISGTFWESSLTTGDGMDIVDINLTAKHSTLNLGDGFNIMNLNKGGSNVTYKGGKDTDLLTITGALSNSNIDLGAGDNQFVGSFDPRGKMISHNLTNVNITATGDGKNSVTGGVFKAGEKGNTIDLGTGDKNSVQFTGINSTQAASLTIKNLNSLKVTGSVKGLELFGTDGDDTVELQAGAKDSSFHMGKGDNTIKALATLKNGDIVGQAITNVTTTATGGTNAITVSQVKSGKEGMASIEGDIEIVTRIKKKDQPEETP